MATLISQPIDFVTGLRALRYVFDMPSVGVAPEQKFFIYRILVNGVQVAPQIVGTFKRYVPTSNGQDITIECENDLRGILKTPAPPFGLAPGLVLNTTIIQEVTIEYGERTINTETCEDPIDTVNGITDPVDVLNGIVRNFQTGLNLIWQILSKKPKLYSIRPDSSDYLYVTGTAEVSVRYDDSAGNFISNINYLVNETHPGGGVAIIPMGFQGAPANASIVKVDLSTFGANEEYIIRSETCECLDGVPVDLYIQNHLGGVDLVCFDCVEPMSMNVTKQQQVNRYDPEDIETLRNGQRRSINNTSHPVLTLRKQFQDVDFQTAQWLNELAASNNAWLRHRMEYGIDDLVRMEILNGSVQTFGKECELVLSLMYSEVELFAY